MTKFLYDIHPLVRKQYPPYRNGVRHTYAEPRWNSCLMSVRQRKQSIITCATMTRMNIVSGYTVEYATAGESLLATLLA